MHQNYIGCDGDIELTNDGYLRCAVADGAQDYSEQEVIDLYSTPKMDQEDFQAFAEHATLLFVLAFGIKLIRKILGV